MTKALGGGVTAELPRDVARKLLAQFDNPDVLPILRKHLELESGPSRQALEQIVRALSVRAPVG